MNRTLKLLAALAAITQFVICSANAYTFKPLMALPRLGGAVNSALVLNDGILYDVTYDGLFFSVDTNGDNFTTIYTNRFTSYYSGLTLSDGLLYGLNEGQYGGGSLFTFDAEKTNLASVSGDFTGFIGAYVVAPPLVTNGMVYGATVLDGTANYGAVFAVGTNGQGFTNLHVFAQTSGDGSQPEGVALVGSALFGTTQAGGANSLGTIFTVETNGSGYEILHSFSGKDGSYPQSGLVAVGNKLYGTATAGGSNGDGCIFSINADGSGFTDLHSFDGTDGADPVAALTVSGSTLFGTTAGGGTGSGGTLFEMNVDGKGFVSLFSFPDYNPYYPSTSTNADGSDPTTSVVVDGDTLYGIAPAGGPTGTGMLFSFQIPKSSGGAVTVTTNGSGRVTPNINGEEIVAGKKITLTATPGAGFVFSNWSGSIQTNSNPLVIEAEPGIFLQANFVTNPFIKLAGVYTGTLYPSYDAARAVLIKNLTVTTKGTYSGSLVFSNKTYALSGAFSLYNLQAYKQVAVPYNEIGPFEVTMTLSDSATNGPNLYVYLEDHDGIGACTAYPGAPSGSAARYNVVIPPDSSKNPPTQSPGGYGYLTITTTAGSTKKPATATYAGVLADGSVVSGAAPAPVTGLIPIYAPLYAGKGILHGWVPIATNNAATGYIAWDAPISAHPATGSRYYLSGFQNMIPGDQIQFAPWTDTAANFESLTNLVLPSGVTNITISATGVIKGGGVTGQVNPKTGTWTAKSGKGLSLESAAGVIIAGQTNRGFGYTIKTNSQAAQLTQ